LGKRGKLFLARGRSEGKKGLPMVGSPKGGRGENDLTRGEGGGASSAKSGEKKAIRAGRIGAPVREEGN